MFDSSRFLVDSIIKWAALEAETIVVSNKGENERGLILIKQELCSGLIRIWVQTRDINDNLTFTRRFHEDQTQDFADAFIEREVQRDEDLWVLVQERSSGSLPDILMDLHR